jgi:glycosyltransferase involved in cell wall biosynthesis
MPPKFTIITCTWNSEPFVRQTILSVESQKYTNIEHVFIDGGSTDGTLELIQSLKGNVKFVTGVQGGIAAAMNEGVRLATGNVITHLHSDDYYLDENVLKEVALELDRTEASWLFGRTKSDIDGRLIEPDWKMPKYSYRRLLKGNFIMHPATFVKRKLFLSAGGFDPSIKFAMDYDLWLRLGKMAEPVYLNRFIAAFRCHPGSFSSANPLAALEDDYQVRQHYIGNNLIAKTYHYLHFAVRRRRLKRIIGKREILT